VFIPRTNFTFDNNRTNVIDGDNQRTTEFLNERETNEAKEESGGGKKNNTSFHPK